jgi:uncharacterized protein with GYD domain
MQTYMILARFTDKAAMAFADRAGADTARRMHDRLSEMAAHPRLGGRLDHLFVTTGEDELVLIISMPRQGAAVAFEYALTRLGVRTRMVAALDVAALGDALEIAYLVGDPNKIGGPSDTGKGATADQSDTPVLH